MILGELVCDTVEGFDDVAELRGFTLVRNQYPCGQGNERPYTPVLDSAKTLFQVGEVRQDFQQRTDGSTFTVVVYLLNGVKTLVNIPGEGE